MSNSSLSSRDTFPFDPSLENWQQCQECENTCCLEGMCMACFTWTCEECGTACKNCGAEVNV